MRHLTLQVTITVGDAQNNSAPHAPLNSAGDILDRFERIPAHEDSLALMQQHNAQHGWRRR